MAPQEDVAISPQPRARGPVAAEDESPLRRGLQRSMTGAFFPEDPRDEEPAAEEQPLLRQGSRTENRQRFETNQRSAARSLFARSMILFALSALLGLAWFLVSVYFYWMGWWNWWHYSGKACDQPLGWWLLVTLLLPLLSCVVPCCPFKSVRFLLQFSQLPVLLVGIWLWWHSGTCATTNPEIYYFVRNYLIFLSVSWSLTIFLPLIVVAVVIYGMSAGWFDEIHGADPEVIKSIETVDFDPSLFSQQGAIGDTRPAPECCICSEAYCKTKEIKRTPCQHIFHEECLGKWLKVNTTCPLCRSDLQEATMASNV